MPTLTGTLRRALRLLTRPVRLDSERRGVVIHAYRGYGSRDEVFLIGRLLRQSQAGASHKPGLLGDLIDFARWASRWGIAEAPVVARLGGTETRVLTDDDGYFRIELQPRDLRHEEGPWHAVELEAAGVTAVGRVYVPPPTSRVVVVSDIDDTLVYTGVANRLKMFWNLFFKSAESRVAFPGAAALYRALYHGATGDQCNPMLYVSRGPWSIYEVLDAFFALHRIPVGPILFLREWGMTLQRPLPPSAKDHKLHLIRNMMALYDDRPFVLIGDSGQRDPEIYARIVREHPERVSAVYIRDVSRDAARNEAITTLADEVARQGSRLLLAADSFAMAEHAHEQGLIAAEALADVQAERAEAETPSAAKPTREVRDEAGLEEALDRHDATGEAVAVESEESGATSRR